VTLLGLLALLLLAVPGTVTRTLRGARRLFALLEQLRQKRKLVLKAIGVFATSLAQLFCKLTESSVKTVVLALQEAGDLPKVFDILYVIDLKHDER
jgi:hypothetical protein